MKWACARSLCVCVWPPSWKASGRSSCLPTAPQTTKSSTCGASGDGAFFHLPPITTFRTSLCLTWESLTGLAAFWVDGRRSTYQVYKPGHTIRPKGTVLLGQDPDKHLGDLEAVQSFVGEVTDLNMWDYVLPRSQIQALHYEHKISKGNIFDWATIEYQLNGNVMVVDDD